MSFLSHGPTRVPFLTAPVLSPLARHFKSAVLLPLTLCVSTFIATGTAMAAIPVGGTPYGWGANASGQLGNAANTGTSVPVKTLTNGVLAGKTVTQIAEGSNFTLALCSDGTLASWGYNRTGELGDGTGANSNVPVLVDRSGALSGKTVTQIAAGNSFCLVLCSDGKVYSWGLNSSGQLGNVTNTNSLSPVAVSTAGILSGKTVTQIAAGGSHAMALCSNGTLAVWGDNTQNQLGLGLGNSTVNEPVSVNTSTALQGKVVSKLAAGSDFSLVSCSDNSLVSWGNNSAGQLGLGSIGGGESFPRLVDRSGVLASKTISAIAAGNGHCVVLCSNGDIATWGNNGSGQLGNGSTANTGTPVLVDRAGVLSGKTVVEIAAGSAHSVALCTDGTVADWGNNSNGELGNNSTTSSSTPVLVDKTGVLQGKAISHLMKGGLGNHTLVLGPGNNAPVVTGVTITPSTVKTDTVLTATPAGTDADGDTLTYTYQWKKGGVNIPNATTNQLNLATAGNGDKGDKITVVVTANDGKDNSAAFTSGEVTVGNTAPVATGVSLAFVGTNSTNGVLKATPAASDTDGDSLTYTYVWQKNDEVVDGATGDTLDLSVEGHGDKGDKITVTATANDGTDSSAAVTSAEVIISNSAPVATGVTITPTSATTNTVLTASATGTDADGDALTYTYQWQKNDVDIADATNATLDLSVVGNKGDKITVLATANDGTTNSASITSAGLTIDNSAPVVTGIDITPTTVKTDTVLTATPTGSDADGDSLTYTYQWQKNDVDISGATNSTLDLGVAGNGNKGDKIKVRVTITDGNANSPAFTSGEVTVGNTAPVTTGVSISPTTPGTNSVLTATVAATDADSDTLTYTFKWQVNGSIIDGQTSNTLDLGLLGNGDKGDVIIVHAIAHDGTDSSSEVTSAPVSVGNTAPTVTGVTITPTTVKTDTVLTAVPTGNDVDNDTLTYAYQWQKNDVDISGATNATLDLGVAGNGNKGDKIKVLVIVTDGDSNSSVYTSAPVTVGNTLPTMDTVSISPADPKTNMVLTASASGSDVDGDTLTYSYVWKKNDEVIAGQTGNTLNLATAGNGNKGDKITVVATANDGTGKSTGLTSASVTVADTAPVVNGVNLTPTNPNTNSVLTATPSGEDDDNDTLTYTYVWKKNNEVISGQTGNTLNLGLAGNGDNGDKISVTVIAHDGNMSSTEFTSAQVTIADPIVTPTLQVSSVTINPNRPQTDSEVAAVVVATGPAGVKLTYSYQWKKNGLDLVGETGRTMDLGKAGRGDRNDLISVEVRAHNGALSSDSKTSAQVPVVNAGPTVSSLTLTPSNPKTNTILKAVANAVDPDGDPISYVYVWLKNGVKIQGEEGQTLDLGKPGNGDTGDKISVLIKARDYSAASAPVTSAELTITNSGPIMTSLTLGPTNPGTNDTLTATAVGYDPDGDVTRYQFEWQKNGIKIQGESGATLNLSKAGNGDDGDVITVIAKIRDASAASSPMSKSVTIGSAPLLLRAAPPAASSPSPAPSAGNS